jgi:hypothetical protein
MVEAIGKIRPPRPRTPAELTGRMLAGIVRTRPAVADALQSIKAAEARLGVHGAQDVLIARVKAGDTPDTVFTALEKFAGQNELTLSPGQTANDLFLYQEKVNPRSGRDICMPGNEVCLYLDAVGGRIGEARAAMTRDLPRHFWEQIGFNHHLLRGTSLTPYDCLAKTLADLGIVREDLPMINWKKSGPRALRRRLFTGDPQAARQIKWAERTLAGPGPFTPAVWRRLYDVRLDIVPALFSQGNLRARQLQGICKPSVLGPMEKKIARTFPFVTDRRFDPWEPHLRRLRAKVFANHQEGKFLADVYDRLTSLGVPAVDRNDIERAIGLTSFKRPEELERLKIGTHFAKTLEPQPSRLELSARAFAVFREALVKPDAGEVPAAEPRFALPAASPSETAIPSWIDWSDEAEAAQVIWTCCVKMSPGLEKEIREANLSVSANLFRSQREWESLIDPEKLEAAGAKGFKDSIYAQDLKATARLVFPLLREPVFAQMAARREEFIDTFSQKYPRLQASLARVSLSSEISARDYDQMFVMLELERERTIAQLKSELPLGSRGSLVIRFTTAILEILSPESEASPV